MKKLILVTVMSLMASSAAFADTGINPPDSAKCVDIMNQIKQKKQDAGASNGTPANAGNQSVHPSN